MYQVFQFRLSEEARDHLNTVGWGGDFGDFPEIAIMRDVSFAGGSDKFEPWMEEYYTEVALIQSVEMLTMNNVFHIGNGYGVTGASITKYKPMHSMSIGDIVIAPYGNAYMCDSEGWTHIENFKKAA